MWDIGRIDFRTYVIELEKGVFNFINIFDEK